MRKIDRGERGLAIARPGFGLAATGVTAILLGWTAGAAEAAPRNVVLRQLTQLTTGTIYSVALRLQDGADVAFVSDGDVMGPGTQTVNRQVYVWREQFDGFGTITQVTNGVDCESWGAARPTDTVLSDRPEVIAFVSTCNWDPTVGNVDGNPEIFFYETDTAIFHQITNTLAPVVNDEPFTSDSGRCLVFRSNGDLDNNDPGNPFYESDHPGPGYSNPDGSDEVFLYGKLDNKTDFPNTGTYTQVSNGPVGTTSSHPVINGYYFPRQCQTTAFQSDFDQLGTGFSGQGIYIYKMPMSALEPITAAEIPNGFQPGIYRNPNISGASNFARGPHIVFESEPDLWLNDSGGTNIFDWRDFHPRMTQYTDLGDPYEAHEPSVADGGGVIAFASDGEILNPEKKVKSGEEPPFNADHNNEIFRLEGRKTVWQITNTTGCQNQHASLKDDGDHLAFSSTCDIIAGINPNGAPQVFLWSLQKSDDPIVAGNACLQEAGCCLDTKDMTTCYHSLRGRKVKIDRPGCLSKPKGCGN
jgi:hypothetical protein